MFTIIEKIYNKKLYLKNKKINTINIHSNVLDIGKIKEYITIDNIYSLEDGIYKNFKKYKI